MDKKQKAEEKRQKRVDRKRRASELLLNPVSERPADDDSGDATDADQADDDSVDGASGLTPLA